MTANERRLEKKRKLKEAFDTLYDQKGDEFYDTWKAELEIQAKVTFNLCKPSFISNSLEIHCNITK